MQNKKHISHDELLDLPGLLGFSEQASSKYLLPPVLTLHESSHIKGVKSFLVEVVKACL